MSDKYVLNGHEAVLEPDLLKWAQEFENLDRRVAETIVGENRISTVFLGLDHSFHRNGRPLIFETMVFPKDEWRELDMDRYSTWDEAEAGHRAIVKKYEDLDKVGTLLNSSKSKNGVGDEI